MQVNSDNLRNEIFKHNVKLVFCNYINLSSIFYLLITVSFDIENLITFFIVRSSDEIKFYVLVSKTCQIFSMNFSVIAFSLLVSYTSVDNSVCILNTYLREKKGKKKKKEG